MVIATGNPHKVTELREILAREGLTGIEFLGLADVGPTTEPIESGKTFAENATIKALSYAKQTGLPALADDSGLEIDALHGKPGVISSHYYNDGREDEMKPREERDALNNARVLRELANTPPDQRTARFVCVMVLAIPQGTGEAGFQPALSSSASPSLDQESGRGLNARLPGPMVTGSASKYHTFSGQFEKHLWGDLPHWQRGGVSYFVTFRVLHGEMSPEERQLVCDAALHWNGKLLWMQLATVMPDHVHLIFRPLRQPNGEWPTLPRIMQSIKGFTAREIQKRRGAFGPFWQQEYWDRIIREHEWPDTWAYVWMNPVEAGLVERPQDYPFTVKGQRPESGEAGFQPATESVPSPLPEENPECGLKARLPGPMVIATTRGTFEGRIGQPPHIPRGQHGFGYDPLFLVAPGFTHTSAELPKDQKNALSHRGHAARAMAREIAQLLRGGGPKY